MKDSTKTKVRIGVAILTIILQTALLSVVTENKTQEFIIMVIGLILLSEGRIHLQRLAMIREEEIIETRKIKEPKKTEKSEL